MPAGLTLGRPLTRVLLTTDAVGGVWNYALELARGFANRNIVTVLAVLGPKPDEHAVDEARAVDGLQLVHTGLPLDWTADGDRELVAASAQLVRLAEHFAVDIVHVNTPCLAIGAFSAPVIVGAHSCLATWWRAVRSGPLPDDFEWRTRLTAAGLATADGVIVPSASFASALAAIYRELPPMTVVRNGRTAPRHRALPRQRCAFTAGRLWDEGKNAAAIDRAAMLVDAPVYAAGPTSGPNGATASFGHLKCLGAIPSRELARWYATAGGFVSAARYEPFGLTVLEAAQSGAPLVLSDIPTFRELWDGAASFVDPDDPEQLAAAMQRLLDDKQYANQMGAQALVRAAAYSAESMISRTIAIYRSMLIQARDRATILKAV